MSYSELWPSERESYINRSRHAFTMDIPDAVLAISGIEMTTEHLDIKGHLGVGESIGAVVADTVVLVFPQQPAEHVQNAITFAA